MKLNLGCGNKKIAGFCNVDKYGDPDLRLDLERMPWPWKDNSVDEIYLHHVLEHLGESKDTYLGIWKEMYRVLKPAGVVIVVVPHPRCSDFLNDPTHVRPVTPESLTLFNQRLNREWQESGAANSTLGLYLGIDFRILTCDYVPTPEWLHKFKGETDEKRLMALMQRDERFMNNVVKEIRLCLVKVAEEADVDRAIERAREAA